ncbi:MAG: urease accessory protein UreJ, partial [Desertifilum sp. SIO1I2]|nr:urease accessory protein UreJ [Desertifilum sp. SIO1I2]
MIVSQKRSLVNSKPTAVGALLAVITCSIVAAPAYAHHPTGAQVSRNFLDGFLSGLGHPIIGLDHLLFAIATGLLAATVARGYWIPIAFILAALLGTGLHLLGVDLPILEIAIAVSVLGVGILLVMTRKPRID